jgi:tripartite ATP-independent transporter DctP family solute receptor
MIRNTWLGMAACLLALGMSPNSSAADFTFVHASLNPENHIDFPVNMDFVDRVKKLSNGRIDFKVFAGGVLGDERQMAEQVESGTITTARITPAILGSICPGQMILNLPFLFSSAQHMFDAVRSDKFAALCQDQLTAEGIRPIAYWWMGVRDLFTKTPVAKVEDVQGLKLRVWEDEFVVESWKALKAIPTPIPLSELYTSLQTGIVDGAEGWIATYNSRSYHEVARNVTILGYINIASTMVISQKTWDKLPADLQQVVSKAAAENAEHAFKVFKAEEDKIYAKATQNKANVVRVADLPKWQSMTAPVIDKFGQKYGPRYAEFIKWVKSTQ